VCYGALCLRRESEFQANFIFGLLQGAAPVVFTVLFWAAVLEDRPAVGGWGLPELCVHGGFASMVIGIIGSIIGLREMGEAVISGELDKYIVRPMCPVWGLIVEYCSFSQIWPYVACGVASIVLATTRFQLEFSLLRSLDALFLVGIGAACWVLISGCVGLLSNLTGNRMTGLWACMSQLEMLYRIPVPLISSNAVHWIVRILAVGFIATYPSAVFLGKFSGEAVVVTNVVGVTALCAWGVLFGILSRACRRAHESFGG